MTESAPIDPTTDRELRQRAGQVRGSDGGIIASSA